MPGKVVTRLTSGNDIHVISSSFYGTCSTAENTRVKEVVINNPNINKITLVTGMLLSVKFINSNTAANPALEILDNKGTTTLANVISLACYGDTRPGTAPNTSWIAGSVVTFVYDGLYWVETSGWDTLSFSGGTVSGSITATGQISADFITSSRYIQAGSWLKADSGAITLRDPRLDRDGTAPSSAIYSYVLGILDKDNELMAYLQAAHFPTGNVQASLVANAENNGANVYNALSVLVKPDGTQTYSVSSPANFRTAIGLGTLATKNSLTTSDIPTLAYLPTSGGTITGSIINKISSLTRGTTPSANTYRTYEFTDKNNKRLGMLEFGSLTDNRNIVQLRILGNYASGDAYGGIVIEKTKGNTGNTNMIYNANTGALSGFTCSAAVLTSGTLPVARLALSTPTFTAGSFTLNSWNARQRGGTVVITVVGTTSVEVPAWSTSKISIGTVSVKPPVWTQLTCIAQNYDTLVPFLCGIDTDGKIWLRTAANPIPAKTWLWVHGSYVVA